jgi:hypothetical protein
MWSKTALLAASLAFSLLAHANDPSRAKKPTPPPTAPAHGADSLQFALGGGLNLSSHATSMQSGQANVNNIHPTNPNACKQPNPPKSCKQTRPSH